MLVHKARDLNRSSRIVYNNERLVARCEIKVFRRWLELRKAVVLNQNLEVSNEAALGAGLCWSVQDDPFRSGLPDIVSSPLQLVSQFILQLPCVAVLELQTKVDLLSTGGLFRNSGG